MEITCFLRRSRWGRDFALGDYGFPLFSLSGTRYVIVWSGY